MYFGKNRQSKNKGIIGYNDIYFYLVIITNYWRMDSHIDDLRETWLVSVKCTVIIFIADNLQPKIYICGGNVITKNRKSIQTT